MFNSPTAKRHSLTMSPSEKAFVPAFAPSPPPSSNASPSAGSVEHDRDRFFNDMGVPIFVVMATRAIVGSCESSFPDLSLLGVVRCDKGKPACGRCTAHGYICNYSMRRSGKVKKQGTKAAIIPEHKIADWPAQNPTNQKGLLSFSDKHLPFEHRVKEFEDDPQPTVIANSEPEFTSNATFHCIIEDSTPRFPANLDKLGDTCSMLVPDIRGFPHNLNGCCLDFAAEDTNPQHTDASDTQMQWTPDLESMGTPAEGNCEFLQCWNIDEVLHLVAEDTFNLDTSATGYPTTPAPFVTTSERLIATPGPVWEYWWSFYKIGSK